MHLLSRELGRDLSTHDRIHSDEGFAVFVAMDSSEAWGEPFRTAKCNLSASEVYEYFTKAGNVYKESMCLCANKFCQAIG